MISIVIQDSLVWLPEKGIGYYPVSSNVYDASYFEKYGHYAETPMGRKITEERAALVRRHFTGNLLDVGIGSGQFVDSLPGAQGYDVNPDAVKWLKDRDRYADPYTGKSFACMTFWDSLEHIKDPTRILRYVKRWVFVSMPIYTGLEHLLSSKHFRKDEHFWYFTEKGLTGWFKTQGFQRVECNDSEIKAGREDIKSFAFRRVADVS